MTTPPAVNHYWSASVTPSQTLNDGATVANVWRRS